MHRNSFRLSILVLILVLFAHVHFTRRLTMMTACWLLVSFDGLRNIVSKIVNDTTSLLCRLSVSVLFVMHRRQREVFVSFFALSLLLLLALKLLLLMLQRICHQKKGLDRKNSLRGTQKYARDNKSHQHQHIHPVE